MFDNRLEFKSAIVGTALGDSSLPKGITKGSNACLCFTHSQQQKEYALFKKQLLEYLTGTSYRERPRYDKRTEKTYYCVEVSSQYHPFYTKLRDRMYVDGRKQITEHILRIISPLGLALWYMDDGTFNYRVRNGANGFQVYVATDSFSEAEHDLAQYWLLKRFGIRWKVNRVRKPNGEMRYRLALYRKDEVDKLFNIVEPYIIDSMRYKITYEMKKI